MVLIFNPDDIKTRSYVTQNSTKRRSPGIVGVGTTIEEAATDADREIERFANRGNYSHAMIQGALHIVNGAVTYYYPNAFFYRLNSETSYAVQIRTIESDLVSLGFKPSAKGPDKLIFQGPSEGQMQRMEPGFIPPLEVRVISSDGNFHVDIDKAPDPDGYRTLDYTLLTSKPIPAEKVGPWVKEYLRSRTK